MTVVNSPSAVPTLCEIRLMTTARKFIQPDLSTASSVRVADELTIVTDSHTVSHTKLRRLTYKAA